MALAVPSPEKLRSARRRESGFSCPLHPLQVLAWVLLVWFLVSVYGLLFWSFRLDGRVALGTIIGVLYSVHIISNIIATSIDPEDDNVIEQDAEHDGVSLPRSPRLGEQLYCMICETVVGDKSKHCRACDKCVSEFDHHCKWLNNCVGGKNYRVFLVTIGTAFVGAVIIFLSGLLQFVAFYTDVDIGDILYPYEGAMNRTSDPVFTVFSEYIIPHELWQSLVGITALLSLVAAGLLGHLLFFHIYLIFRGVSTYDYIMEQRKLSEQRANDKTVNSSSTAEENTRTCGCVSLCCKSRSNFVSPNKPTVSTIQIDSTPPDMAASEPSGLCTSGDHGNKESPPPTALKEIGCETGDVTSSSKYRESSNGPSVDSRA